MTALSCSQHSLQTALIGIPSAPACPTIIIQMTSNGPLMEIILIKNAIIFIAHDYCLQGDLGWGLQIDNFLCSMIFLIFLAMPKHILVLEYLTDVTAPKLRWDLTNMNVIQIT